MDKNFMEQILEIDGLRLNLKEVEEMLLAIRSGAVDALVVRCDQGERVRALQGADQPFRVLVDAMGEGAVLLDQEGTILYSNLRFAQMVGKDAANLAGTPLLSALSPRADPAAVDPIQAGLKNEVPGGELTLCRPDGTSVEVRITLSRFHVDGTTLLCLVATDLGDQRRLRLVEAAERKAAFLARAGELLASSFDLETTVESVARISIPILGDWCWVHLLDETGGIRRLAVAHWDSERVDFTKKLDEQFPPSRQTAPLLFDALDRAEAVLYPELDERFFARLGENEEFVKGLRQLHLGSIMVLPLLSHGRVLGTMSFATDGQSRRYGVEDLELAKELASRAALAVDNARLHRAARLANEALERRVSERTRQMEAAIRELEAFTYTVAHDLRAPLRAMAGCIDLLTADHPDLFRHAEARDYLDRISCGAKKMDSLIEDLLSFSRLGRVDLNAEVVPLDGVVKESVERLWNELRRSGGRVVVESPLPSVRAHRGSLIQIMVNLLSNALKFVAPGTIPEVTVGTELRDAYVRITVRDNGIGIPAEYRDRIFGVFERLNQSERYPGTGIGLAIVRRVAERMGGRCGVESRPGEGSRFWVELPAE